MKTACIIAEYNPFHNGHARMARQLHDNGFDAVIAVMSGNAVQRGVPALLPKEVRARAALCCGIDLVIELPCRAAAAAAQPFAAAGVAAAAACGAHTLAFGAENAELPQLQAVCRALRCDDFSPLLKAGLQQGMPFYAARSAAAEVLCPGAGRLLAQPNNILAIEYLLALQGLPQEWFARRPQPLALPRCGAAHDGAPDGGIASAGWLRARPVTAWQPYVPQAAFALYRQAEADGLVLDAARWECAALALLRSRTREQLAALPDVSEGLDALLYTAARECVTLEEVYRRIKSKRYTHARIRRLVLAAVLGWQRLPQLPQPASAGAFCRRCGLPYLRELGATAAGRQALGELTPGAPIPVSASLAALQRLGGDCAEAAAAEAALCDLTALCRRRPAPCGTDYRLPFLRKESPVPPPPQGGQ